MSRDGVHGIDVVETINAAASVIAYAETRRPRDSVQRRRCWGSCLSLRLCFGLTKNNKRTVHAAILESATTPTLGTHPLASSQHPPPLPPPPHRSLSITVPVVAPPSSPASFFQSAAQSPAAQPPSVTSSTPTIPTSIFTIGPYAYETQPVSPPTLSTFTTEPSTPPYTPPPESVHPTTPSSPEVPFARLLDPNSRNGNQRFSFARCEFQPYQLPPGSPVSRLISPRSGTSSPFPDRPFFPKLLDIEKIALRDWGSCQASGSVTPDAVGPRLDRENSEVGPLRETDDGRGPASDDPAVNYRVSFEVNGDELLRCAEKKTDACHGIESGSFGKAEEKREISDDGDEHEGTSEKNRDDDGTGRERKQKKIHPITAGSSKEFNFDSAGSGICDKSGVNSSPWWVNENVAFPGWGSG